MQLSWTRRPARPAPGAAPTATQTATRGAPPLARVALGAWLAVVAACSQAPEAEQGTPLAAFLSFHQALQNGDYETGRSWCLPGELQTEFVRNTFETRAAAEAFRAKVVSAWGEAELQRFFEPPGAIVTMDFAIPEESLKQAKVTELGQVAYVTLGDGMRVRLAKLPEGWRFDSVGTENPQEIQWARMQQQFFLSVAQILRRAVEKIDALPPATDAEARARQAESFDLELGRVLGENEDQFNAAVEQMQRDAQAQQAQDVGPAPPPK